MKTWFPLAMFLTITVARGQDSSPSQAEAVTLYPDLAVAGSPMNKQFVATVQKERAANDPEMQSPNWPMKIAQRVAGALGVMPAVTLATPTPTPDPAATPTPTPAPDAPGMITDNGRPFQASDVQALYETNEVLADAKLKDRTLAVKGTIDKIGKDLDGVPYVQLTSGDSSFFAVQCMFGDDDTDQLAQLRPGQQISIAGVVRGKPDNVVLVGCHILAN